MKKTIRALFCALILLLSCIFPALSAEAENRAVIFISDTGTGDGSSPDTPLGNGEGYEVWSQTAYQQSAINLAIAKLAENGKGGIIVVTSPVTIKWGAQGEADAKAASDFRFSPTALDPSLSFTFTSVYNGVDYREENDAAILVERTASQALCLKMNCSSTWRDITLRIHNTANAVVTETRNVFACNCYPTLFGEGYRNEAYLEDSLLSETPANMKYFPILSGGTRYENSTGDADLTVISGTWQNVTGASVAFRGTTYGHTTGDVRLRFGGTALSLHDIMGGTYELGGWVSGDVFVQISGGKVYGIIDVGGDGGYSTCSSRAMLTVTGGDFSDVTAINAFGNSIKFNAPGYSELDCRTLSVADADKVVSLAKKFDAIIPPERVIFIKDGGKGDGSSASSPLSAADLNLREEQIKSPQNHYNSALYQATLQLAHTGGTIVLCGEVKLDASVTTGSSASVKDFFFPSHQEAEIKITSTYGGVDYAKTAGARLVIQSPANVICGGPLTFENVTICTMPSSSYDATNRVICGNGYDLTFGEGVTVTPLNLSGTAISSPASNLYPSVNGGHRYNNIMTDRDYTVTLKSGTFYDVSAGTEGFGTISGTVYGRLIGNSHLVIDGTAYVKTHVYGTSRKAGSTQFGDAYVTINGGKIDGCVYLTYTGGFGGHGCRAYLTVNGGTFGATTYFYATQATLTSDSLARFQPECTTADLSGLGSMVASTLAKKLRNFNEVIFPSASVSSAAILNPPARETTSYQAGDTFDPEGLKVKVVCGSTPYTVSYDENPKAFTFSPSLETPLAVGTNTVTVNCMGKKIAAYTVGISSDRPSVELVGAMIKLEGEKQGLRFVASITSPDLVPITRYGIVYQQSDYFTEKSLDMVGATVLDLTTSLRSRTDDGFLFSGAVENIPIEEYGLDYTAFAFYQYEEGGKTFTVYSNTLTRNVRWVAEQAAISEYESSLNKRLVRANVILPVEEGWESTFDKDTVDAKITQMLNNMAAMSSVKWVCPVDIDYKNDSSFTSNLQYQKGVTYTGIPYVAGSNSYANLAKWLAFYPNGSTYTGATGWNTMLGNQCSSAVVRAMQGVSNAHNLRDSYSIFDSVPHTGHTYYNQVGPYTIYPETVLTQQIVAANKTDAVNAGLPENEIVFRSYAAVKRGDFIVASWLTAKGEKLGHIRIADSSAPVYNEDGTLNGSASKLYLTEQCSTMNKTTFTTWRLNYAYTYSQLISGNYLPIRLKPFDTGYFETPQMTVLDRNTPENILDGISGKIVSNYNIQSVELTVENASGKKVLSYAEYPFTDDCFDLRMLDPQNTAISSLPAGNYTYRLSIGYADKTEEVLSFSFTK